MSPIVTSLTMTLARTGVEPGTFKITANVPLTGAIAFCALDLDTAYPDAATVWTAGVWDGSQTTTVEAGVTWFHRNATMLIAGDQAPPRADQLTLAPGEWSTWGRYSDPPTIIIRRFDIVTVLG